MAMHDDPNRTYAKGAIGKNYLSGAAIGDFDDARAMTPVPSGEVATPRHGFMLPKLLSPVSGAERPGSFML
jgi:hypothetical protein